MKRAKRSETTPKASCGERRVGSTQRALPCGAGRCGGGARASATAGARSRVRHDLVALLAPVLGEDVVEHVVDGHRAEQPAVVVDDRQCRRGCRWPGSGSPARASRVGRPAARSSLSRIDADRGVRRLTEQSLDVDDAEVATGGRLERRPADVDRARRARATSSSRRTDARASAIVASGPRMTGSVVIRPPAVFSS